MLAQVRDMQSMLEAQKQRPNSLEKNVPTVDRTEVTQRQLKAMGLTMCPGGSLWDGRKVR